MILAIPLILAGLVQIGPNTGPVWPPTNTYNYPVNKPWSILPQYPTCEASSLEIKNAFAVCVKHAIGGSTNNSTAESEYVFAQDFKVDCENIVDVCRADEVKTAEKRQNCEDAERRERDKPDLDIVRKAVGDLKP